MDSALDKITGRIVEAGQLYRSISVDPSLYICPGCGVPLIPASYLPENQVRAYFRTNKNEPHRPGCDVEGEPLLISRARKLRVTSPTKGFPGSYPSRLQLDDEREVVADDASPQTRSGGGERAAFEVAVGTLRRQRRWTAKTIRPLASTFMNYPFDRDLPLTVPDLDGTRFCDVFEYVKNNQNNQDPIYEKPKIFFAPIQWSKVDNKLVRPYRVRVVWMDWSEFRKGRVRHEIEVARKEAIAASKKNSKAKGWLFFLGRQVADDLSLFLVKDHRLICCIADELIWPRPRPPV